MSIKPKIFNHVPAAAVRSRISPEFHDALDDSLLRDPTYTVIAFPGMRGESSSIVDSKTLAKALRKASRGPERVVTVAHAFTVEAKEILIGLAAVWFSKSDFYWSDSSWASIRNR
ncbi:hypothetical protein ACFFGH_34075 [Lysobacter korlensis]|uniref:Uncharacterized protein n=1 Tax=Lysobacter korlensis TaxID=553636 RepID=A0ABV6S430_9GAMM